MKNSSIDMKNHTTIAAIGRNAHTNGQGEVHTRIGGDANRDGTTYRGICSPVTRKITRRPTTTVWSPKRS
ncbi:hypothetical protein SAMN04490220_0409 [Rhodococcus jostii]|uniref:Uncharacterized protein n=1 Tax=Rhodococcus jostii TaxID=132919 RepID=A0A1H4IS93_RHOJO|nr:hypothetical protein SAMN04490220_0409 [Rhodococcus jostii]